MTICIYTIGIDVSSINVNFDVNMSCSTTVPTRINCIECSLSFIICYLKACNNPKYISVSFTSYNHVPRKNVVLSVIWLPPPGGPGGRVPFIPGGRVPFIPGGGPPPLPPSDALRK
jgi:hypothetical protein